MPRLPKIFYSPLFISIIISIFLVVSVILSPNTRSTQHQPSSVLLNAKAKFEGCYKEAAKMYYTDSNKFFDEFSQCIKTYIPVNDWQFDNIYNGAGGEKKVFLPLDPDYPQDECKWLTIGIGGDTIAEETFKKKYPKCKFFGADPGHTGNFAEIGTLIPNGVGELVLSKIYV